MAALPLPYFLSRPSGAPRGGVVVIHEGGGMTAQLLRFSERLAGEGYVAVAPDLFSRAGGPEAAPFAELIGSLDPGRTMGELVQAMDLARQHGAAKVGVTGFCMGGLWTYRAARAGLGFSAAVGFYGGGIVKELGEPSCPTQLFFGGSDPYIPTEDIAAVQDVHPNTVVYDDADHGFMRDGSPSHHPEHAADAWSRLLAFFDEHLGS